MIKCICKNLSCEDVIKVIQQGNYSLKKVQDACGAGTDCGSCCKEIVKMVDQEKKKMLEEKLNNIRGCLDEVRVAVGDLTLNDLVDLLTSVVEDKPEPEAKDDEDEETLQ